jgi:transposase
VTEEVLGRAGRYKQVADNLEVKQVIVDDRRYVVCRNPIEARKDAAAREAILGKLEDALAHSPKSVLGNVGFKRFTHVARGGITIDRDAVARDARLDGKFVLRTNTELEADQVALAYKSLWRVERAFRETKSTLEVRPVFHHRDDTTIGHIVGCFLALRLEVDLQRRLDERDLQRRAEERKDIAWPDLMRDLRELRAVYVTVDEQRYRLRTELRGHAAEAFAAAGIRPPRVCETLARV